MIRNKDKDKLHKQRYFKEFKKKIFDILGYKCGICSQIFAIDNLQIDHINPSEKSFAVSTKSSPKYWLIVVEELKKCQAACKDCHFNKSVREFKALYKIRFPARCGTETNYGKGCRCRLCKDANAAQKRNYRARKRLLLKGRI